MRTTKKNINGISNFASPDTYSNDITLGKFKELIEDNKIDKQNNIAIAKQQTNLISWL